MSGLVLSLFPGIGLLDMAFEAEGFCVVRGPDLLWGGDIRKFHPPAGKFDGVIGGPPCQTHSTMTHLCLAGNGVRGGHRHGDMIPEFVRIVEQANPEWFLMENVKAAPTPSVSGYFVSATLLNNRWLGEDQNRLRKFCFGSRDGRSLSISHAVFDSPRFERAVLAGHGPAIGQRVRGIQGRAWQQMATLQGLPEEWIERIGAEKHFTTHGYKKVIGNGVPLPMGRAVAKAVKAALQKQEQAA